jgi:hypothetical protein
MQIGRLGPSEYIPGRVYLNSALTGGMAGVEVDVMSVEA